MRAEHIVGVSFFALLIPAIVVVVSGSRKSLTSRQRALWRGWGLSLISVAVIAFGLVNFQLIHSSLRPVVEGNLRDIRELHNDAERSTQFMITDAAGHAVQVLCRYTGPGLVEGERARLRYVAYNQKLLDLDMLTGSYTTWHLRESSGENDYWWLVGIGAVFGFVAFRQLAQARQRTDDGLGGSTGQSVSTDTSASAA